ncbi:MAG: DUF1559 domain-containing protein, partial [Planctomycetaceae bacterium]
SNLAVGMRKVPIYLCPSAPDRGVVNVPVSPDSDSARPALGARALATTDYEDVTGVKKSVVSPDIYPSGTIGDGAIVKDRVTKLSSITDGTSKTVLIAECAGRPFVYRMRQVQNGLVNQCVGWSDSLGPFKIDPMLPSGIKGAAPGAGVPMNVANDGEVYSFHPGGAVAVFCDGSTRFITDTIDLSTFCALITKGAAETVSDPTAN